MRIRRVKGHGLRTSISLDAPTFDAHWHFKVRPKNESQELIDEASRTKWLRDSLPVPRRVAACIFGLGFLATSTVEGVPSHKMIDVISPLDLLRALSDAVDEIQRVSITSFPFSVPIGFREDYALHRIDDLDSLARQGKVLHPDFKDSTRAELRSILVNEHIKDADQKLTHGDLCMPNLLLDESSGKMSGVLDVGAVHVGDANMDISILSWSVAANMGSSSGEYLLGMYEIEESDPSVQRNRLIYDLSLPDTDCWAWIRSTRLEEQRQAVSEQFDRISMEVI